MNHEEEEEKRKQIGNRKACRHQHQHLFNLYSSKFKQKYNGTNLLKKNGWIFNDCRIKK